MSHKKSKVLVTGAFGFLGHHVCEDLHNSGYDNIVRVGHGEGQLTGDDDVVYADLRDAKHVRWLYEICKPDVVIHLAASCGGIGINQKRPGDFFYDNMKMGLEMIHGAANATHKVSKFVLVSTVCGYPKHTPIPFKEEDLWNGYPEETNAPYGIAKKSLSVMLNAYRDQYGLNGITLIPVNMYGPRDDFDPNTSHVIPALIKQFDDALPDKTVTVWGTGNASREFLYVRDCAAAIRLATQKYNEPDPINIGTGEEITIDELVEKIAELVGHTGNVTYDISKPDGQPRRCLDITKMQSELGFTPTYSLDGGLENTYKWYREHVAATV